MPVRFLLDENVPASILRLLKKKRFDVISVRGLSGRGLSNGEVARKGIGEDRIILTPDSDFLALRREILGRVKILFVDIHPRDPKRIVELLDRYVDKCLKMLKRVNVIILSSDGPRSGKTQQ